MPEQPRYGNRFFKLWAPIFANVNTITQLNSVVARYSADWLEKANSTEPETTSTEFSSANPPRPYSVKPSRNQSRAQQRARKKKKFDGDEASRVQKLFRMYPRRAVRHVLGDKSPAYTGTLDAAKTHLHETYHRPLTSTEQCDRARTLFNNCCWTEPDENQLTYLGSPPTQEHEGKVSGATNTAAGQDGLEYRHLRMLDPQGKLLEVIFSRVRELGIPETWKESRTVPIFKKASTDELVNFRPISLLCTQYKILSGLISRNLCAAAVDLGWISNEQKAFLSGIHGIQEHTQLLQAAVEETKTKKRNLYITWLDLCKAFGSVPHPIIAELLDSIPIPTDLRRILVDIHTNNIVKFAVGKETVSINPAAGVRQEDALSSTFFNLVAEPLIRAARSSLNPGFQLFGQKVKTTAYADDISVVSSGDHQDVLDSLVSTAGLLGLSFNGSKCCNLSFLKGKPSTQSYTINGEGIRSLGPNDHETYLGFPIGTKTLYRPPTLLIPQLDKVRDSLLAPYQKLEVYRAHLLPSLCHHLASGRCEKETLESLDIEC